MTAVAHAHAFIAGRLATGDVGIVVGRDVLATALAALEAQMPDPTPPADDAKCNECVRCHLAKQQCECECHAPADDVREALTTVEELEALPTRSVVMDGDGGVWRKTVTGLWDCLDGQCDQPVEESKTVLWQSAPPRVMVLWASGEVRPHGTVTDAAVQDVPGFEGTRAALDSLTTRGGESS